MDEKRILSKIREMDSYVAELEQIITPDFNNYVGDNEKKRASERILQIAIESLIDVCYILGASLRIEIPSDEEDIISRLVAKGVISRSLANLILDMKGFRNILVHKYGTVDDEQVFEIIQERLSDFSLFKKEILNFLEKKDKL